MKSFAMACIYGILALETSFATGLHSGPMPGHVGIRDAIIWLQTSSPTSVTLEYWAKDHPSEHLFSDPHALDSSTDFTAHIGLHGLQPGTVYEYRVFLNEKEIAFTPSLTFHTQPLWLDQKIPLNFEVVVGSCSYINETPLPATVGGYGGGFEIFNSIANRQSAFMLWMGDFIYFRKGDFHNPRGMAYRYRQARSFGPLQKRLQSTHHVAIWDDHDFGLNNANRAWIYKDQALEHFQRYWANPSYGLKELRGIFTVVSYGDIDFFLLDNRFYRDDDRAPEVPGKAMFGKAQLDWLKNALLMSTASFKIIAGGSQFFDNQPRWDGWNHYPKEKELFLEWFRQVKPKGVMFLSGDRHTTKFIRYNQNVPYPLYELTCSPLTSRAGNPNYDELNHWVVEGTMVGERNFCTLNFSGERFNRTVNIQSHNTQGTPLWSHSIKIQELQ
jgi:alkaline phosphatase D